MTMKKTPPADTDNYFETSERPAIQTYLRLLTYLKPLLPAFIVSVLGFGIFAATAPMLAKLMEAVIRAIEHKDSSSQWILPLMAIGIFVLRGVGAFIGTFFNSYVGNRLITHVRVEIFNHLTTLPAEYFNTTSDGRILQRLTGSVNLLSKVITAYYFRFVGLRVLSQLEALSHIYRCRSTRSACCGLHHKTLSQHYQKGRKRDGGINTGSTGND